MTDYPEVIPDQKSRFMKSPGVKMISLGRMVGLPDKYGASTLLGWWAKSLLGAKL